MPSAIPNDLASHMGTPRLIDGLSQHTPKPRSNGRTSSPFHFAKQQLFKVGHQKVSIDVNLSSNSIEGITEISVIPLSAKLKVIKLDCRELKVKEIYINGSPNANYIYDDVLFINDPSITSEAIENNEINVLDLYSDKFDIHQHHFIKRKLNYIFGERYTPEDEEESDFSGQGTQELKILLPENIKFEPTDINSITTPRGSQPNTMTPTHLKSKHTISEVYKPIQIKIVYELKNPKNGVNFITNDDIEKKLWHAYTTNSEYNVSTSSWVPCLDNFNNRCTWSLDVSVPRTLKDIGNPRIIGSKEAIAYQKRTKNTLSTDGNELENEDGEDDEDNPDLIVCSADTNNVKEAPHPIDLSKKVVSWSIFNPVSAHHIGWALGFFESIILNDGSQTAEGDEINSMDVDDEYNDKDSSSSSVTIYALPSDMELAKNTCLVASRALSYYSSEFGSYPFSSYVIVFVKFSPVKSNGFAGLSILSTSLLYPPNLIEPMFISTDILLTSIAAQWSGINIAPHSFDDIWCTSGIAGFMAISFVQKLMGTNEFRFKVKELVQTIVEQDVDKRPIAHPFLKFPVSDLDLEFIRLKSQIVFFILDNRMTKTDKSFGLSRVIPKLFLQALSGDLPNGTLSTDHFQYVCEKVNRNKLDSFFKQWVFGSGAPSFKISQRFNKKKGMIEMTIRQVQHHENKTVRLNAESFIDDALCFINKEPLPQRQNVFTGPMNIRVHESDGTPYEHIIHIKEVKTTIDISLSKKVRKIKKKDEGVDPGINFNQFGDILISEEDKRKWELQDWESRDEDSLGAEPFEWIRGDIDFEWIAKIEVLQPDFMYGSQLVYDRDVEAQFDALRYFGNLEKPSVIYCTALVRTFLDERYFYRIRIAAAEALATCSNASNDFIGMKYLIKAYKHLYCFPDSSIPKANDFNDFKLFLIQRAVPGILCRITDDEGRVPKDVQDLLFNFVKFNDNAMNDYQDTLYLSDLIKALTTSAISGWRKDTAEGNNQEFAHKVNAEITRLQKLDEWRPSYQRILQTTCFKSRVQMALYGAITLSLEEMMMATVDKFPMDLRAEAFKGLLLLSGFRSTPILEYFLKVCLLYFHRPLYTRKLVGVLLESITMIALEGSFVPVKESPDDNRQPGLVSTSMIIIDEGANSDMKARHDLHARATLKGAIDLLRRDYSNIGSLKHVFWTFLHSALLSNFVKRNLFLMAEILYEERDTLIVKLPVPSLPIAEFKKKVVARNLGDGQVVLRREGRFKIQLISRKPSSHPPNRKTHKSEETNKPKPSLRISFKLQQDRLFERNEKETSINEKYVPRSSSLVKFDPSSHSRVSIKLPTHVLKTIASKPIVINQESLVSVKGTIVKINFKKHSKDKQTAQNVHTV
ncbi:Tsm1 transcription initiation factor TFIID subunit [Candida orthopsilosis Co 90-125]|uniref:Transcription initiation factor TFIID subunit 2 n=1 Tax=Candida orthopsilosis (strain 90-125) TaxID=1136231 RepID=H8X8K9_CANO9|nr:Tsm1 transcription initiation factor TFIID subunit [Candida orthopsilosis Co 90-125]CCG24484.1 Tsm1 transcription initiation factor TFIID subunit [Candida orthopsilosis Co 90-125]